MKVKKLGHAGITVKNLEKALDFYCSTFGFEVADQPGDWVTDPNESLGLGAPANAYHRICSMKTANGEEIELVEFTAVDSPNAEGMPVYQIGQHHLSFEVEDIFGTVEELKAKGIEFLYKPVLFADYYWVLLKDPDGICVEITGR